MQILKEHINGMLYEHCCYSAGYLPKTTKKQRSERKKITDEAKKIINENNSKYNLMRLCCLNFKAGKDLFVYLGYKDDVTRKQTYRYLEKFHLKMKKLYSKLGLEYKYICVTEEHRSDGTDVRLHHHLIMTGIPYTSCFDVIAERWKHGSIDVRALYMRDGFEDTVGYLIKQKKDDNKRRYSSSQNLTRPAPPVTTRIKESEGGEIPPGVKIFEKSYINKSTYFGRYCFFIGQIVDFKAFNKYMRNMEKRRLKRL